MGMPATHVTYVVQSRHVEDVHREWAWRDMIVGKHDTREDAQADFGTRQKRRTWQYRIIKRTTTEEVID